MKLFTSIALVSALFPFAAFAESVECMEANLIHHNLLPVFNLDTQTQRSVKQTSSDGKFEITVTTASGPSTAIAIVLTAVDLETGIMSESYSYGPKDGSVDPSAVLTIANRASDPAQKKFFQFKCTLVK